MELKDIVCIVIISPAKEIPEQPSGKFFAYGRLNFINIWQKNFRSKKLLQLNFFLGYLNFLLFICK